MTPDRRKAQGESSDQSLKQVLTREIFADLPAPDDSPADKALMQRPVFSFRARLILAFSVFFVLALVITLWSINVMGKVQRKIKCLEVADDFKLELQQARRFEKNFLLYGTNLDDALEHIDNAQRLQRRHRGVFVEAIEAKELAEIQDHIHRYTLALSRLRHERGEELQKELRENGAALLEAAGRLIEGERRTVHRMLDLARRVPFVFLVVLFAVGALQVWFLARQVLATLTRFMGYTERIASGDFTPILPARKYRDEFSTLALALNRMTRELDRHHRILVESHKLRALGTLVAGVAHELNNPLNNILLTASLFRDDFGSIDDEEKQQMLADIISQSERARQIVRNLLDFARESEVHLQPLDMKVLLDETVKLVQNQVRVKKLKLEVRLPDRLPVVHGDRQMLQQVFLNLLLNAVDVLEPGGVITITSDTGKREGFLAIDVRDNGPGIPEHIRDRIFDPFFTTKPQGKGTGLGLSVSRGIVRKLGGYLLVESSVGKGTTFSVLLPITQVPSSIGNAGQSSGGDDQ